MRNVFTTESTPYSEGTGLFCRVPWPEFSRAPWIIHPIHLSRFAVRFARPILRSFSRKRRLGNFRDCSRGIASRLSPADLPAGHAYALAPESSNRIAYRSPSLHRAVVRLTLGRLPLPRKPWIYGECVSRTFYRYSCQHNHFPEVQHTFRCTFNPQGTLPYQ